MSGLGVTIGASVVLLVADKCELVRRETAVKPYGFCRFSGKLRTVADKVVAEGMGFEPTIRYNPYNGLANRRLQPLGHPSTGVVLTRRMHQPF